MELVFLHKFHLKYHWSYRAGSAAMKELALSLKDASSVLICLHLNKTRRTIKTTESPGITPLQRFRNWDVKSAKCIAALDGGINASNRAAEAARLLQMVLELVPISLAS